MCRIIVSVLHGLFSSVRTRMELQLEVPLFATRSRFFDVTNDPASG
jgi:hypothetical protein